jgi:hypothetical protein
LDCIVYKAEVATSNSKQQYRALKIHVELKGKTAGLHNYLAYPETSSLVFQR